MESFCLRHSIPPYLPEIAVPFHSPLATRFGAQPHPHRFLVSSKKSDFQDFQDYAKPLRLVPATQVKVCTNSSSDELIKSSVEAEYQSLYRILLRTSPAFGSELTYMSAGILVCIISETGESILQRIPASSESSAEEHLRESEAAAAADVLHFKRSSVDEFIFQGPKLGNIEAVWISLESGRWRLGGANLTVINRSMLQSGESIGNDSKYTSVRYDFEAEDMLLGEGGDVSMIELRPNKVTEYSGINISQLLNEDVTRSTFLGEKVMTNEESMREYADLKLSLLLYDTMLVFAGTSVASLTAGENSALAFLTGGMGGFLYLLLLQRSVDGLPAPNTTPTSEENGISRAFGGLKGPLLITAFAFGFALLLAKSSSIEVAPKEIMVGMIGFLACKLAVVLAAFKPLSIGLKEAD